MAITPQPLPPLSPLPNPLLPPEPEPVLPPPAKPWYRKFIPDVSHLRNPGKFEEYSKEAQEITGHQEYFDGMKFEFARALSENFMVQHSLHMGAAEANFGGTYSFCPQVSTKNKKTALFGRFDGDGRVMGRIYHAITQNFAFTGVAQVSAEQSMVNMETTYAGGSWTGSAKLEGANVVELTMMQSIASRASLGVQILHIPQPHGAITGSAVAARFWSKNEIHKPLTQQRVPRWVAAGQMGTLMPFHASFTWHTPYKADFATELALQMKQDGGLETLWCAGALYSFVNGRIKARVDSHARVGVFIEEGISPNMSAFICGDLDHLQNKYKFGFGITLQS